MPLPRYHPAFATLSLALAMAGCSEAAEKDGSASYSFNCNEARGALATLEMMQTGQARIDAGGLGTAQTSLKRLAEEKAGPESVMRDLDAWRDAVNAHGQSLTSFQPVFVDGRFAEPDTTAIDRTLLGTVKPIGERLDAWVAEVCGRL